MSRMNKKMLFTAMVATSLVTSFPILAEEEVPLDDPDPVVTEGSGQIPGKLSTEFDEFLANIDGPEGLIHELREGTYGAEPEVDGETGDASDADTGSDTTDTTTADTSTDSSSDGVDAADTANGPEAGTEDTADGSGKMGWGNVRISLKLAEENLAMDGITQPTSDELAAALLGGEDASGILALRAEGMGWGEIAQEYGYKLGEVMGNGNGKAHQYVAPTDTGTTTAGTSSVTTASGKGNGYISSKSSNGHAYGRGIVTASGGSVHQVKADKATGQGHVSHSSGGVNHAGGNGHGFISTGSISSHGSITSAAHSSGHGNTGQAKGKKFQ